MTQPGYGDTVGTNEYLPQALGCLAGSSSGEDAVTDTGRALDHLAVMQGAQCGSKWGVQPGPEDFESAYSGQLTQINLQLIKLRDDAQSLHDGVELIGKSLTTSDEEGAAYFARLFGDGGSTGPEST